jgi:CRP-like cAMP-binding protein
VLAEAAATTILDRVMLSSGAIALEDVQLANLTKEAILDAISTSRVMADLGEVDDSDAELLDYLLLAYPLRHET